MSLITAAFSRKGAGQLQSAGQQEHTGKGNLGEPEAPRERPPRGSAGVWLAVMAVEKRVVMIWLLPFYGYDSIREQDQIPMEGTQDGTFVCVSYMEGTAWLKLGPMSCGTRSDGGAPIRRRRRRPLPGRAQAVVAGQRTPLRSFWHTDVYEKRDGRWQVVWSQATLIQ